jgi:signal transduction histidine kinase
MIGVLMSIRKKLFVMMIVTIICASGIYYHTLSNAVDFAFNGMDSFSIEKLKENPDYRLITKEINDLIIQFERQIHNDVDELLKARCAESFQEAIKSDTLGFNIRRNNEIIYKSPLQKNDYPIQEYPEFGTLDIVPVRQSTGLNAEENIRIIKQIDFYFSNGDVGIIYIFIKRDLASEIRSNLAFGTLFISLFLIIILGVFNSLFIYRSISKPLGSLVEGVEKMKGQNYDFSFDTSRKDEISALAESFEELRVEMLENKKMRYRYEKDRKEFIDNITHDINTPITSASMNIDAILDGVIQEKEKEKRYLENIKNKIAVISRLLDELSLISEMDLNQEEVLLTEVNVEGFFKDIIDEFNYEKKYENIKFVYNNVNAKRYAFDIQKIRRALLNIIENSIKYHIGEKAPEVFMETKIIDGRLLLIIEDNGPGVQGDYSNIFKRFYRGDESRSSKILGSGLGLSIVRKIIEMHGGKIKAMAAQEYLTGLRIEIVL